MQQSYWSNLLSRRTLTRRRLLVASSGAAAAVALSLTGCGGKDSNSTASSLLGKPEDTTAKAVSGGTWPDYLATDIVTLDALRVRQTPDLSTIGYIYSTLLKAGISTSKTPGAVDVTGDAAQSFELSPDGLQLTLKLRAGHKFDARPPTNGRAMDSADVKWSWDKFLALALNAQELANAKNPASPIASLETPDSRTVVLKLAFPHSDLLQLLAAQYFFIEPADDKFDFQLDMRGSGPYVLQKYGASLGTTFKKNPDWYDTPRPFFDTIERPLLPEYAAGLAQLAAKNIWNFAVRPEDILSTKKQSPDMLLLAGTQPAASIQHWNFSKQPDSIWQDVRLRRAFSMVMDRELLLEVFFNIKQFTDAGLPVTDYWNSHIGAGSPEWLDPRGTGLGEGAKYFQFNVGEARKLVEAAGQKTPVVSIFNTETGFSPDRLKQDQALQAQVNDSGIFQLNQDVLDFNTTWRRARESGGMGFPGILTHFGSGDTTDINLNRNYTPNGTNATSAVALPIITDLVYKQRQELDQQKRVTIIEEIQKQLALAWPCVLLPGDVPAFTLRWPWLKNHGIFRSGGGTARPYTYAWYDKDLHTKLTTKTS